MDYAQIAAKYGGKAVEITPPQITSDQQAYKDKSLLATWSWIDVLKWAGKGILSSAYGMWEMLEKTAAKLTWQKTLSQTITGKEDIEKPSYITPQNTAEKLGYYTEQVWELLIPIMWPVKAVKLAQTASKAQKALQLWKTLTTWAAKEWVEFWTKTAVQTWWDMSDTAKAAAWWALWSVAWKLLEMWLPKVVKAIEKSTLRLSTSQKQNMEKQIERATNYLDKNKIIWTPNARYEKIDDIYNKTEDTLQTWLKEWEAAWTTVPREQLKTQLDLIPNKYKEVGKVRDLISMKKQIKEAKEWLDELPENIPTWMLNNFKRQVYKDAYNKAWEKVIGEVEHDIWDIARLAIEKSTEWKLINGKSIEEFNNVYWDIISAKKLLKIAKDKSQVWILWRIMAFTMWWAIARNAGMWDIAAVAWAWLWTAVAETMFGTLPRTLLWAWLDKMDPIKAEETVRKILSQYFLREKDGE
jgi:archaellum component FlaC